MHSRFYLSYYYLSPAQALTFPIHAAAGLPTRISPLPGCIRDAVFSVSQRPAELFTDRSGSDQKCSIAHTI